MNSFFFCFLVGESEYEYTRAIEQFNDIIREWDLHMPNVVVTDNCRAVKNALKTAFLELPQLLCTWHIPELVQHHMEVLHEEGSNGYEKGLAGG